MLKLSTFDYFLPKELIAQHPLKERDRCRLLVINRQRATIEHRNFCDIVEYIKKDDLLVLNNTKVLPCRLQARRLSGGKVELLLLAQKSGPVFQALIKPGRLRLNEKIVFASGGLTAVISGKGEVTFSTEDLHAIYDLGEMPLPPYIKRFPQASDRSDYQTVYAKKEGAIAAPTAGMHFTKDLLKKIEVKGAKLAFLTLHVGYGTFHPVKQEDITQHKMEKEYFNISPEAQRQLNEALAQKNRIIAIGTTALRSIETYASGQKEGYTDLFIYPGYRFRIVDCLLTNFHLPRTTLFMLSCAFAGTDLIKKAYQEAIEKKYRFYSYGDAMLIL